MQPRTRRGSRGQAPACGRPQPTRAKAPGPNHPKLVSLNSSYQQARRQQRIRQNTPRIASSLIQAQEDRPQPVLSETPEVESTEPNTSHKHQSIKTTQNINHKRDTSKTKCQRRTPHDRNPGRGAPLRQTASLHNNQGAPPSPHTPKRHAQNQPSGPPVESYNKQRRRRPRRRTKTAKQKQQTDLNKAILEQHLQRGCLEIRPGVNEWPPID